jgi:methyltransferase-like protein
MAWEAMRFRVNGIDNGLKKVEEGKNFLAALANSAPPDSTYRALLWEELKRLVQKPAGAAVHDEFEPSNQPFYFHEFSSAARSCGLKFFTEADPQWLNFVNLPPATQAFLRSIDTDIERREQYIDFIRCSRFRNALVCREDVKTSATPDPAVFKQFFLAAEIAPVSDDEKIGGYEPKQFTRPDDASLSIGHPLTKAALVCLAEAFPNRILFEELIIEAQKLLSVDRESDDLDTAVKCLTDLFVTGYVRLHSFEPSCTYALSDRPIANTFARWQATSGSDSIALLNQITMHPEIDITKDMILLLDGTRDHADLAKEINESLADTTKERIEASGKTLAEIVEENLTALAKGALLIE